MLMIYVLLLVFNITIGSCNFMQLAIICKYICEHRFEWSINLILLKIDIHVWYTMTHVWNTRFLEVWFLNSNCKLQFMQLNGGFLILLKAQLRHNKH